MPTVHESSTRLSLLASLVAGQSASQSWPVFVEKYGRLLYRWATRWGAGPHDAEEIIQETLLLIYQKLDQYQVQPGFTFRSWLKTVAYRCWLQFLEARKDDRLAHLQARMSPEALRLISSEAAKDDLILEFDRLAYDEILDLASQRVKAAVSPDSWACFHLMYYEKITGQQIADRLGLSLNSVYCRLTRVRQSLQQEIQRIDDSFVL